MKPTSSYLANGGTIQIPHPLESLDHEVELAVVMGKKARDVAESAAMDYVGGIKVIIMKFDYSPSFLLLKLDIFITD